jgi:hypothetical protein
MADKKSFDVTTDREMHLLCASDIAWQFKAQNPFWV